MGEPLAPERCFRASSRPRHHARFPRRPRRTTLLQRDQLRRELEDGLASGDGTASNVDIGSRFLELARGGDLAGVEALLAGRDHAAVIDVCNENGATALYLAALEGHTNIVAALLSWGADPNRAKTNGATALFAACYKGHTALVRLLLSAGASIALRRGAVTPLWIACQHSRLEVVQVLLAHGAAPDAAAGRLGSPLRATATHDNVCIIKPLLAAGADPEQVDGVFYRTALHAAACSGALNAAVLLVRHAFADACARDGHGCTPAMLARRHGHRRLANVLGSAVMWRQLAPLIRWKLGLPPFRVDTDRTRTWSTTSASHASDRERAAQRGGVYGLLDRVGSCLARVHSSQCVRNVSNPIAAKAVTLLQREFAAYHTHPVLARVLAVCGMWVGGWRCPAYSSTDLLPAAMLRQLTEANILPVATMYAHGGDRSETRRDKARVAGCAGAGARACGDAKDTGASRNSETVRVTGIPPRVVRAHPQPLVTVVAQLQALPARCRDTVTQFL